MPQPGSTGVPTILAKTPTHGLRWHLIALVLVALLPTLAVGAAAAWQAMRSYETAFEERLVDTARALALAVDREIEGHLSVLTALAASPQFDDPTSKFDQFSLHARRAAEALHSPITVIGPDLQILLDTDRPSGDSLPFTRAAEAAAATFASRQPMVSNLVSSSVGNRPVVAILVPVVREERTILLLATRLEPQRLAESLASQKLEGGAFATVMDSQDAVVARSSDQQRWVGVTAAGWLREAFASRREAVSVGRSLSGIDIMVAHQALRSAPGWKVLIAEPLAAYNTSWAQPLLAIGVGGALALTLSLLAAFNLYRRIIRPVDGLIAKAEAVASNTHQPEPPVAPVLEFEQLRRSLLKAEGVLSQRAATVLDNEARLKDLLETVDLATVMVRDVVGTIRFWSAGCERLYGWTSAEAVGQTAQSLLQTVYPIPRHDIEARLRSVGEWSGELRHQTRSGREIVVAARKVLRPAHGDRPEQVMESVAEVTDLRRTEEALRDSEARFARAVSAARVGTWDWDPVNDVMTNSTSREEYLLGRPKGSINTLAGLIAAVHPADKRLVLDGMLRVTDRLTDDYEVEFRTIWADGSIRWLRSIGRAVLDEAGKLRTVSGVSLDVTEQVRVRQREALLAREVDHRAKNALAVVQSMLRLTPITEPKAFITAVEGRISALARAHSLLAEEGWSGASLKSVVEREMAPHGPCLGDNATIIITGPPVPLVATAVQPLAMVLHELATNAAKYGALSRLGGTVVISWQMTGPIAEGGMLHLTWAEHGGPGLAITPERRGFGSRVIEATIKTQLGGKLERQWPQHGLLCQFWLPLTRLMNNDSNAGGGHSAAA